MHASFVVRRARGQDAERLQDLERQCFGMAQSLGQWHQEIADRRSVVLVAETDAGIVGFAAQTIVLDEAHITNFGVEAAQRRRGLGSALLAELCDQGRAAGAVTAYLEVRRRNSAAQQLYSRFGFEVVGVRQDFYWDPLDDGLVMVATLVAEVDKEP